MNNLPPQQRFWIAVLVIGGYLLFGGITSMTATQNLTIAISVLSTMGPLVGFVVKGLFDSMGATGKPSDPVNVEEVP